MPICNLEHLLEYEDRGLAIRDMFDESGVPYEILRYHKNGPINIAVHFGTPWKRVFSAHYDYIDSGKGTGANDNAASVAILITLAENMHREGFAERQEAAGTGVTILFTDGEERLGYGRMEDTGAYQFGLDMVRADQLPELFLVLELTGIGDVIVLNHNNVTGKKKEAQSTFDFHRKAAITKTAIKQRDYLARKFIEYGQRFVHKKTPIADHFTLQHLGIPAVLLTVLPDEDLEFADTWEMTHTPDDNILFIEENALNMVHGLLWSFAVDLPEIN